MVLGVGVAPDEGARRVLAGERPLEARDDRGDGRGLAGRRRGLDGWRHQPIGPDGRRSRKSGEWDDAPRRVVCQRVRLTRPRPGSIVTTFLPRRPRRPSVSITGQLGRDRFGYSMPVDAPLYEPFPLYYEDTRILLFPYLTDAKKAARARPGAPRGRHRRSAGHARARRGRLREVPVQQHRRVQRGGADDRGHLQGLARAPMPCACTSPTTRRSCAGREIGGFPKKMGVIGFDEGEVITSTLDAPAGQRICSAELAPLQPVPWLTELPITYYSLRVIPNPADPKTPVARPARAEHVDTRPRDVLVRTGHGHLHRRVGAEPVSRAADPPADAAHEPCRRRRRRSARRRASAFSAATCTSARSRSSKPIDR